MSSHPLSYSKVRIAGDAGKREALTLRLRLHASIWAWPIRNCAAVALLGLVGRAAGVHGYLQMAGCRIRRLVPA